MLIILMNFYRHTACLFVDGDVLYSEVGTTQGDAISCFNHSAFDSEINVLVTQVWYADDVAAHGKISHLCAWWD